MMDRVTRVDVDEERITSYLPAILDKLDGLDREDLIMRFISLEFNRFLDSYKNLPDLTPLKQPRNSSSAPPQKGRGGRDKRGGGSASRGGGPHIWLTLNVGKIDGVTPQKVITMVNSSTRGQSIDIGKIDIGPDRTRLQIEEPAAEYVMSVLKRRKFQGKRIKIR